MSIKVTCKGQTYTLKDEVIKQFEEESGYYFCDSFLERGMDEDPEFGKSHDINDTLLFIGKRMRSEDEFVLDAAKSSRIIRSDIPLTVEAFEELIGEKLTFNEE